MYSNVTLGTIGIISFLKRLFGSAKEASNELADKAELALKKVKKNATPYIEKAESFVEQSIEKANDYTHQTKEVIGEYADGAGDILGNIVKKVKESAAEALKETDAVIKETKESHADMTESEGTLTNDNT